MSTKKNTNIIIFLILGCAFLFIFKIIPVFLSLFLSFKEYQPVRGFFGSPWVGFENFKQVLGMPSSAKIFLNAIRLNLFSVLLALPISGIFIYCANRIQKRGLALALTTAFALAAVFPQVVFAGFVTFALGIKINASYDIIYALFEALRLSGFVAVVAFFMSADSDYMAGPSNAARLLIAAVAVALLAGVSKYLSSDFELASIMQNPMIYERAEVIDTFYYKAGFMQMRFGISSALWLIKYSAELIAGAAAAVGVFFVLKAAKRNGFKAENAERKGTLAAAVCAVMAASILAVCIAVLIPKSNAHANPINIGMNIVYIVLFLAVSVASAAAAAALAYPFASHKRAHKIIYAVLLVPSLYAANGVQQYLIYRMLGMVNTALPLLLSGFLPAWMIAVYAIIINRPAAKDMLEGGGYFRFIAPAALTMAAASFSFMWGSYGPAMIYTMDPSKFTAALQLRSLMLSGQQSLALNLFVFLPTALVWTAAASASALMLKRK